MAETKIVPNRLDQTAEFNFSEIALGDGSLANPSLAFQSDPDTGIRRDVADNIAFSVGGSTGFRINGTGSIISSGFQLQLGDGTELSPSYSFGSDSDTGMWIGGSSLNFSWAGTNRLQITSAVVQSFLPFRTSDGSASVPSLSFTNDIDTGFYRTGSPGIAASVGNSNKLELTTNQLVVNISGTAAAPAITLGGDNDTGLFRPSDNAIAIATGGTVRFEVDEIEGYTTFFQAQKNQDASAATPAITFINDPDTGFFRQASGRVGFSTNGFESVRLRESNNGDGVAYNPIQFIGGFSTASAGVVVETNTVSTTPTHIGSGNQALCIVYGDDGSNNRFTDVILYIFNVTPIVLHSNTIEGSPAARTYTNSSGTINLAMGSGTYNIGFAAFDGVRRG